MPTITVTWVAVDDERTCPVCKALDGYTWTFTTPEPIIFNHPTYGVVWTREQGSQAHGHHGYNCRCHIEMVNEPDISDITAWVSQKLIELEAVTP